MSQYKTQGVSLFNADQPATVSENPTVLLERILSGKDRDAVIAGLIAHLGRTSYSITDLMRDVARIKERIATTHVPTESWCRMLLRSFARMKPSTDAASRAAVPAIGP
jgi:hypothetical protein